MRRSGTAASHLLFLAAGILCGWAFSGALTRNLHAGAGDYPEAAIVATGPVEVSANERLKIQVEKDAVYYLNYAQGFLYAAVPLVTQRPGESRILSDFAGRDLARDFGLRPQARSHFTMVAGQLGTEGDTNSALYVFETVTGQMAAYRVVPQITANSTKPTITLLEKRPPDPRLGRSKPVENR